MGGVSSTDFSSPDEVRTPDKTRVEVEKLGNSTINKITFDPGWRWSECIKPVAGTDSCQAEHLGVLVAGQIGVRHNDGTEATLSSGEAYHVEPGHDAWVVGDEPAVCYEFSQQAAATDYAKG